MKMYGHMLLALAICSIVINSKVFSEESVNSGKVVVMHLGGEDLHYGFTNQLILLGLVVELGCSLNAKVIAPEFKLEIGKADIGDISQYLNVEETNSYLGCTQILPTNTSYSPSDATVVTAMQMVVKNGWRFSDQMTSFVFADSLKWIPKEDKMIPSKYNGIHFRLEMDWIIASKVGGNYFTWLSDYKKNNMASVHAIENNAVHSMEAATRVLKMIECYKQEVIEVFQDKTIPIILATGLGKGNPMDKEVEWILPFFRLELEALGYETIIGSGNSTFRELNAASELKLIMYSENFIGDGKSSFTKYITHMRTLLGQFPQDHSVPWSCFQKESP